MIYNRMALGLIVGVVETISIDIHSLFLSPHTTKGDSAKSVLRQQENLQLWQDAASI